MNRAILIALLIAPLFTAGIALGGIQNAYAGFPQPEGGCPPNFDLTPINSLISEFQAKANKIDAADGTIDGLVCTFVIIHPHGSQVIIIDNNIQATSP